MGSGWFQIRHLRASMSYTPLPGHPCSSPWIQILPTPKLSLHEIFSDLQPPESIYVLVSFPPMPLISWRDLIYKVSSCFHHVFLFSRGWQALGTSFYSLLLSNSNLISCNLDEPSQSVLLTTCNLVLLPSIYRLFSFRSHFGGHI